jgi:hypothetical protein
MRLIRASTVEHEGKWTARAAHFPKYAGSGYAEADAVASLGARLRELVPANTLDGVELDEQYPPVVLRDRSGAWTAVSTMYECSGVGADEDAAIEAVRREEAGAFGADF